MKKMKRYGILKPKSIEYLLSFAFVLLAISALWISIWITVSNEIGQAVFALELLVDAFAGKIAGAYKWFVLAESIILWIGLFAALIMFIIALIRKKYRAIIGVFALALYDVAFVAQLSYFVTFINTSMYGIFLVFLAVYMFADIVLMCFNLKLTYNQIVQSAKSFGADKAEFAEEQVKNRNVRKEIMVHSEPKEEPYVSTLDVYEKHEKDEKDEDNDLVFQNSNEYRNYMYHDAVDKYLKEEESKVIEAKVDNVQAEPKKDLDAQNSFGQKANNFTFEQKLAIAKPVVRKYFKEVKAYFEELGFKYAVTKVGATFSYKNTKYAQITTAGLSGLKIYYKLNVEDYQNSTIPVKDVGNIRKYEGVPLLFVAKSDLAIRRAKHLMDEVKAKLN